jgi:hypothetical protein
LTEFSLILLTTKPTSKKAGKEKVRMLSLKNCRVKYRDPTEKMSDRAFVVADDLGNCSKFTAKTPSLAQGWVDRIRSAIAQEEERQRQEVEKSLIKL